MVDTYYKKKTKKSFEKKHVKDIKIFLKMKRIKGEKGQRQLSKSSKKLLEHMKKYYLAHEKLLFGHFKHPSVFKFISWISS